jgi:hypothetical protein
MVLEEVGGVCTSLSTLRYHWLQKRASVLLHLLLHVVALHVFCTPSASIENIRTMDRLPMELVCMVFEHLQELDLASTLHSELFEEPTDQLVFSPASLSVYEHDPRSTCWLYLNNVSRAAILDARLASTALYHASHKTFARLLADRTFRFTSIGFQDLAMMSRKKELLHHIRSLALGCAAFRHKTGIDEAGCVAPPTFLAGLEMQDRARLAAAYTTCRNWQYGSLKAHIRNLASILVVIPNLDSIRILTFDRPLHLGGWLEPGDEDLLHRDIYLNHDSSFEALRYGTFQMLPRMYNNGSRVVLDCIMEAIKRSKLTIRDFRADPKYISVHAARLPILTPALHTIRIILSERNANSLDSSMWSGLLGQATNLRDLSLGNERLSNATNDYRLRILNVQNPSGDLVFKALENHKQLRRVELHGGWAFSESAMVEFVIDHAKTLRCFLLSETMLFGSWQHLTTRIRPAMFQKAFLMKVRSPAESPAVNARVHILTESVWVDQQSV